MNLYFAPLEGIGGYIYRNAQADYFEKADEIYIVTLSSHLSGSFNSAELAKSMYLEKHLWR